MRLKVELCRAAAEWVFADTASFDAWIGDRPWQGATQRLGVLRVRPGLLTDAFREAPFVAKRAAARLGAVVTELPYRARQPGVLLGPTRHLGLAADASGKDVLAAIAKRHGQTTVLIVALEKFTASDAAQAIDDLQGLLDLVRTPQELCILVITSARAEITWDCWIGSPPADLLGDTRIPTDQLWSRYLHLRLAWHAGGDWDAAQRSGDHFEEIDLGDDDQVEAAMNEEADARLGELSPDVVESLQSYIEGAQESTGSLVDEELLWRPLARRRLQVTPWAARAMLLRPVTPRARSVLRNAVVCEPLQRALLPIVFEAEWQLRDRLGRLAFAESTLGGASDIKKHPSHRFLPPSASRLCSDLPSDYAALGDLIRATSGTDPSLKRFLPLADVRNALAHGHPIGWRAVCDLRQALGNLTGAP